MKFWIIYGFVAYALVAASMMFISWPYAETDKIPRWRIIRDAVVWPFWFLLLLVEATEQARRWWMSGRVE